MSRVEREAYAYWYHSQKQWKKDNKGEREVKLRGNKKWCETYGEDLSLPRFIGDRKGADGLYPPHY